MRTKFCFFSTFNNFLVLLELEELARKNLNKFCINVSSTKQFVLRFRVFLSNPFSARVKVVDLLAVYTLSNPNVCIITVFILIVPPDI